MNEAEPCRLLGEPKLRDAGWETPPHAVALQPVSWLRYHGKKTRV